VKELLVHAETKIQLERLETLICSRSTLRVTLDGRSLLQPRVSGRNWMVQLKERIEQTSWTGGYIRQSLQVRVPARSVAFTYVNPSQTDVTDKLRLHAVTSLGLRGRLTAMGHARYQVSPKLNISVTSILPLPCLLMLILKGRLGRHIPSTYTLSSFRDSERQVSRRQYGYLCTDID
jgi:hypothetical protein